MMRDNSTTIVHLLQAMLLVAVALVFGSAAFAAVGSIDCAFSPLQRFFNIIQGPVVTAIAMAGIIACGVALVFGGEMKDFVKMMVTIVIVICAVIGATGIFNNVFGVSPLPTHSIEACKPPAGSS